MQTMVRIIRTAFRVDVNAKMSDSRFVTHRELDQGTGRGKHGRRPPQSVATSMDDLEEAFQRRKRRELEQARMAGAGDRQPVQQVVRSGAKVGRNDPCPCGSGKKYKKCCGANA